jgi:hypothetical protein
MGKRERDAAKAVQEKLNAERPDAKLRTADELPEAPLDQARDASCSYCAQAAGGVELVAARDDAPLVRVHPHCRATMDHVEDLRRAAEDAPPAEAPSAAAGDGITMPRAPIAVVPNGAQLAAVALGGVGSPPFAEAHARYLAQSTRIAALELELRATTARLEHSIRAERDALKPAEHDLCLAMRAEKRLVELTDASGKSTTYKTRGRVGVEPAPGVAWLALSPVKA